MRKHQIGDLPIQGLHPHGCHHWVDDLTFLENLKHDRQVCG